MPSLLFRTHICAIAELESPWHQSSVGQTLSFLKVCHGQWIGRETESASLPSSCPSPVHCSAVIKHMDSEGTMPLKHCTI